MKKIQKWIKAFSKDQVIKDENLTAEVLNNASDETFRIEAARRSSSGKGGISAGVKQSTVDFIPQSVKDWKFAVALATDPEQPSLISLATLYDNLMLDAHTMSVIESRVMRVTRSKWNLIDSSGNSNPDLNILFNRPWFEKFMTAVVMSRFTGIKVVELFETNENGELMNCKDMPMAHILPKRKEITLEEGDETGVPYCDGKLANYYIEIGEEGGLGILSQLATYILAKKQAMGAWLDYLYKFGVPPIIINTDNYDKTRQQELLNMGIEMHSNHVMVTQGNETFTIGDVPTSNSVQVFKEFLMLLNAEISKRILGQDGTTENKEGAGTYGSLKVMQEVADDRHESDKLFVQFIINQELIPRLPKINSFYSALSNYTFDWDESDELDQKSYVESAVALTTAGYELDIEELSKRSGITIKGHKNPFAPNTPVKPESKKKSRIAKE